MPDVVLLVEVDSPLPDAESPSVVVEVNVVDSPVPEGGADRFDVSPEDALPVDEELDELVEDESEDVPVVSAADTP